MGKKKSKKKRLKKLIQVGKERKKQVTMQVNAPVDITWEQKAREYQRTLEKGEQLISEFEQLYTTETKPSRWKARLNSYSNSVREFQISSDKFSAFLNDKPYDMKYAYQNLATRFDQVTSDISMIETDITKLGDLGDVLLACDQSLNPLKRITTKANKQIDNAHNKHYAPMFDDKPLSNYREEHSRLDEILESFDENFDSMVKSDKIRCMIKRRVSTQKEIIAAYLEIYDGNIRQTSHGLQESLNRLSDASKIPVQEGSRYDLILFNVDIVETVLKNNHSFEMARQNAPDIDVWYDAFDIQRQQELENPTKIDLDKIETTPFIDNYRCNFHKYADAIYRQAGKIDSLIARIKSGKPIDFVDNSYAINRFEENYKGFSELKTLCDSTKAASPFEDLVLEAAKRDISFIETHTANKVSNIDVLSQLEDSDMCGLLRDINHGKARIDDKISNIKKDHMTICIYSDIQIILDYFNKFEPIKTEFEKLEDSKRDFFSGCNDSGLLKVYGTSALELSDIVMKKLDTQLYKLELSLKTEGTINIAYVNNEIDSIKEYIEDIGKALYGFKQFDSGDDSADDVSKILNSKAVQHKNLESRIEICENDAPILSSIKTERADIDKIISSIDSIFYELDRGKMGLGQAIRKAGTITENYYPLIEEVNIKISALSGRLMSVDKDFSVPEKLDNFERFKKHIDETSAFIKAYVAYSPNHFVQELGLSYDKKLLEPESIIKHGQTAQNLIRFAYSNTYELEDGLELGLLDYARSGLPGLEKNQKEYKDSMINLAKDIPNQFSRVGIFYDQSDKKYIIATVEDRGISREDLQAITERMLNELYGIQTTDGEVRNNPNNIIYTIINSRHYDSDSGWYLSRVLEDNGFKNESFGSKERDLWDLDMFLDKQSYEPMPSCCINEFEF